MKEHVERREGWVSTMDIYRKGDAFDPDDYVRMREVLPGEIAITREELAQVLTGVFKLPLTVTEQDAANRLLARLFGPLPEGSTSDLTETK